MLRITRQLGISDADPVVGLLISHRAGASHGEITAGSARWMRAGHVLAAAATLDQPISPAELNAWLAPIFASCKAGNLSASEIENRWNGVREALDGLPKFIFSKALRVEILRKCEWTPNAAELWPFIQPFVDELNNLRHTANRILQRDLDAPFPARAEIEQNGWHLAPPAAGSVRLTFGRDIKPREVPAAA